MNTTKTKEKKWILKSCAEPETEVAVSKIAKKLGIHPIIARLLYARGYKDEKSAKTFIGMESEMLCNPFLMKDIDKGIKRIKRAISNSEKITIFGDYDVDGVTSVCTLYLYLKSKGANVDYYIPNRAGEGYGVSRAAIDLISEQGTTLIITVDTGITANDEVTYAKTLGIDFVITDHHECHTDIPSAKAVINPHRQDCRYPFKCLAGVGVVFKLVSAYEEVTTGKTRKEAALKIFNQYADLVAIGTIADVMPITDENRIIVSYGLNMIENSQRPGIMALIEASSNKETQRNDRNKKRSKITSGFVGYTLAPRINAAGRIKSATMAVELFLAENAEIARTIAEDLCRANKERQAEENRIMDEAYAKIQNIDIDKYPVLVLDSDNWHHGVIGIVASRITEKYSRPSILVSFDGNDDGVEYSEHIGKGSGRSIKGLNLVDALCDSSDLLVKFGGHELAAGLSVTRNNLPAFINKINEYARLNLKDEDMIPTLDADLVIDFSDANLNLAQQLQHLEPYGTGNPMPTFIVRGIWINELTSISSGKHSRLVLSDGKTSITAMCFSNPPENIGVKVGDKVDVLFNLDVNEWMGRKSAQLILKDIRLAEEDIKAELLERSRFEEIWGGDTFNSDENVLPSREDFVAVYRLIVTQCRLGKCELSHKELLSKLSRLEPSNFGYIKLKIIIKIFQEMNILSINETENEVYTFSVHYSSTKTNLEKSNLLRRLRSQQKCFK